MSALYLSIKYIISPEQYNEEISKLQHFEEKFKMSDKIKTL